MRKLLPFFLLSLIPAGTVRPESFLYRPYTDGHMDIGPRIVNNTVEGFWKNDGATVDGTSSNPDFAARDLRALGIFDENTPPSLRPAGDERWGFLGVEEGEPVYILPSNGVPDTIPYLGFSTEHASIVAELPVEGEVHITLTEVIGPQDATVTVFVSSQNILMTSNNPQMGTLVMDVDDHLHYNWSFSHLGTYDLTFRFELFLDAGEEEPEFVGEDTFRFQITDGGTFDDYDHWRRTHFRPDQITDDSISGPDADAGAAIGTTEGFTNFQRYAFGNHPFAEFETIDNGNGTFQVLRLPMREGMGDLTTRPEFSDSLMETVWHHDDFPLTEYEIEGIFHDPGLNIHRYLLDAPPVPGPIIFRMGAAGTEE